MPSRKRPNLSRSTRNAVRKRLRVSQETEEERNARLANERQHYAESSSSIQRDSRLASMRATQYRANESASGRESRSTADAQRHAPTSPIFKDSL